MALAFFAMACGDDDSTGPNNSGRFTGTLKITGQQDVALKGVALHADSIDEEGAGFGIGLGADSTAHSTIVFYRAKEGVPTAKAYTLHDLTGEADPANDAFVAVAVTHSNDDAKTALCVSKAGTLTITSASSTKMKGTFNLTATCTKLTGGAPYTSTLSGTFDSKKGSVEIPD
jgi:hypothetical protein